MVADPDPDDDAPAHPPPPRLQLVLRPPPDMVTGPRLEEAAKGESGQEEMDRMVAQGITRRREAADKVALRNKRLTGPVFDPNYWNINYGHRRFPVLEDLDQARVDAYLAEILGCLWPSNARALPCAWLSDTIFYERVTRLVTEFNISGLPRTVHARLSHESAYPQYHKASEMQPINPSYRCPCWIEVLGEGWYNMSDADWIAKFQDQESRNTAHNFFIHILPRMICTMVQTYLRDPNFVLINTYYAGSVLRSHRYTPEIRNVLEGMKGMQPTGRATLKMRTKFLTAQLCGLFYEQVQNWWTRDKLREKRKIAALQKAEAKSGGSKPVSTRPVPENVLIYTRATAHGFARDEMLFLDKHLLALKLWDPRAMPKDLDEKFYADFEETFKDRYMHSDKRELKFKIEDYSRQFLNNAPYESMKTRRGVRIRAEAIAFYNVLANLRGAPEYSLQDPSENRREIIPVVLEYMALLNLERHACFILADKDLPTEYEVRDIATIVQSLRSTSEATAPTANVAEDELTKAEDLAFLQRYFGPKSLQEQLQQIVLDEATGEYAHISPKMLKDALERVDYRTKHRIPPSCPASSAINKVNPDDFCRELAEEYDRRSARTPRARVDPAPAPVPSGPEAQHPGSPGGPPPGGVTRAEEIGKDDPLWQAFKADVSRHYPDLLSFVRDPITVAEFQAVLRSGRFRGYARYFVPLVL